jgi:hypothetical protein
LGTFSLVFCISLVYVPLALSFLPMKFRQGLILRWSIRRRVESPAAGAGPPSLLLLYL